MKKLLFILLLIPSLLLSQTTDSWVNFKVQFDFYAPQESNFFMVENGSGTQVFYYAPTISYEYLDTCQGSIINWNPVLGSFFIRDTTITVLPCPPPYGGCTDPIAINYDSLAGWDDGSCIYPPCAGLDTFWVENYCDVANNKVHYRWTNMANPNCRMAYYTRTTDP